MNEGYPNSINGVNRFLRIMTKLAPWRNGHGNVTDWHTGNPQSRSAKSAERSYFFTAIPEISIRALPISAAAWIVARTGLGSGMKLL